MQHLIAGLVFLVAAALEVGGDALVRKGLRGGGASWILLGCLALAVYGIVVNTASSLDFSKLLGAYVAVFAVVSVLTGMLAFGEQIPPATWFGLALIVAGGLVIQFGRF